MIDLLKLSIPFKESELIIIKSSDGLNGIYIDLECVSRISGLRLSARSVEYEIDGDLTVTGLNHPFDSLPTHYSGIAMKIYAGSPNRLPCVEIKASPAKILQGHNVFGSTDLELCGVELLVNLSVALPELYELLDIENTLIDRIDVTFSARVENQFKAEQVINALRNVSNGQTKKTRAQDWDSTCMWNENSRHRVLVAYLKHPELMRQYESLRKNIKENSPEYMRNSLNVLGNPDLHEFAVGLVRFEARLKQRYLSSLGLPLKLFDAIEYQREYEINGKCLISEFWKKSFSELMAALAGGEMNIYSDNEVLQKLKTEYSTITASGNTSYAKALRIFGFYRRLINEGYDNVKQTMTKPSFYRSLTELLSAGFSKAQLQQLNSTKNNVVPLIQVINIDFNNQRPSWYVEPVSLFSVNNNVYTIHAA